MDKNTYYIIAASTISHQDTFGKTGFSDSMSPVVSPALITPDYKAFIDAGLLRRMSKILRMAVACAKDCLAQAGLDQPDAIITGTGLGCLQDTDKFLNTSLTVEGLLPPTAFIQSTHNTMAGQISLSLGNHGYNMTHTQNTLSFEHAMVDALLLLDEGEQHILVGAADEHIEILSEITTHLGYKPGFPLTSGASFFIISKEKRHDTVARIADCEPVAFAQDPVAKLTRFLDTNSLEISDLNRVVYAVPGNANAGKYKTIWREAGLDPEKCINYLSLSGVYPTASAFALNYAVDLISQDRSLKNILIFNALRKENLGLTLVQSVEA
ncbi:beta-ketoacyl synthase chain length factor [Dyadobacter sp. CY343]|uniref:beta-ketoacyl synthase chain length factor n=1 Tax=Dyadobacter sp. CY343 TaxID=2907299 RepID=UPI001F2F863F|nr:beta-ketoacyl synthase chain length factor [Dyadobacter sp. CY343]MCE7062093.1 beta-ketoacyl synthase chain length factor [Dyadobacter sp. CY343]